MLIGDVPPRFSSVFAEEFDVVVVGFGIAGATTAIEAHDAGLKVLVLEKMLQPGGISATSGGGFIVAKDRAAAFGYLKATNRNNIPDDILEVLSDGMLNLPAYFAKLAKVNGAQWGLVDGYGTGPFKGYDTFQYLEVRSIPGFDAVRDWPNVQGDYGPNAFKLFLDNVNQRRIPVRLSTPAVRLITSTDGAVEGVWAKNDRGLVPIKARHGVALCCGGFEAAPDMHREYWQLGEVLPVAFRGNTGDGIRMSLDVGADLWHMWHFHGAYGFRHPDPAYPFGIRVKELPNWTPGARAPRAKMAWILVNQEGRRFMNEYPPYIQDTAHQPLGVFNPRRASFPNIPCYMLVDDEGRQLYRLGDPKLNDADFRSFEWTKDNRAEIEAGFLKRCATVADVSSAIGCDTGVLQQTLDTWNQACVSGRDDGFGRDAVSMVPVKTPPFLLGEMWPVVSNTQGGPVHDVRQRILNSYREPIPHLYAAGELGGAWGFLYLGGGNLSECVINGWTVAQELARVD